MKTSREVGNEDRARCMYPLQGRNEPWGKTLEREIGASMRESSVDLPTKWRGRENRETSGRVEWRRSRCDQTWDAVWVDPLAWEDLPRASCRVWKAWKGGKMEQPRDVLRSPSRGNEQRERKRKTKKEREREWKRVEPGIDFKSFFFLEFLSAPLDASQPLLSLRWTSTNKEDWRMGGKKRKRKKRKEEKTRCNAAP